MAENDDAFVDYEASVDPGPWVILGTAVFCGLSILLFPCMVSVGRRYEKHRRRASNGKKNSDGPLHTNEVQDEEVGIEAAPLGAYCEPPPVFPGAPIGDDRTGRQQQVRDLINRLVTPPYPDEAGTNCGDEHINSDKSCLTILDTGAAKRNRRAGARRFHRGKNLWQNEQDRERRLSLAGRANVELDDEVWDSEVCSSEDSSSKDDSSTTFSIPNWNILAGEDANRSNFYSNQTTDGENFPASRRSISKDDTSTSSSTPENVDVTPADAVDTLDSGVPAERSLLGKDPAEDEELDLMCCGSHAWWKRAMIVTVFDTLLDVATWDRDMERILKLAIPFSVSAVFSGVFETIRIALVAHFIGTDAVAAYTIVLLILGLTEEFFGGFALTAASLCSHAFGNHNYRLAGQYVQISSVLYTLCTIPNVLVWFFLTGDAVRLFGFNEATVEMAQEYARFCVVAQWFEGLDESYGSLLAVIGHERFTMYLAVGNELFCTSIILITCLTGQRPVSLTDVGIIELGTEALFYGLSIVISILAGWVAPYVKGMVRTNALKNTLAVKTGRFRNVLLTSQICAYLTLSYPIRSVFKTAIPLALGQLLQYGEWEVLTIFVAAIDPASVTTWYVWKTLYLLFRFEL